MAIAKKETMSSA